MKCVISVTVLITIAMLSGYALATPVQDPLETAYANYGRGMIPDVAGNVSISNESGEYNVMQTWGLDEITVYPGYPVYVTSWAHEGGVFYNMDADDDLEIIYYVGQAVYALNLDGTNVPGWPQSTMYYSSGAPAIGDIDGDGDDEIVVSMSYTMTTGGVDAFELNGTRVTGFPLNNHGYVSRTATLADLDDDGAMEIIVNKRMWPLGEWWVYSGDGTVFPGWPQAIEHVPASSSAVGDIDGDGIPEIVGESYDGLYVWDINGNVLPGFPFMMPNGAVNSYSAPVLADLDEDGLNEIIFGTHTMAGDGYVFVLNEDGSQLPGWPQHTWSWIYGPPTVGYVDDDNILDIVIGDQTMSPTPMNFIYGWNANGVTLDNFPIGPMNAINNQVATADLDGDGRVEMIVDDNTMVTATYEGKYLAFNHDGTPLPDFPLIVTGCTMFHMPCLFDANNDGFVDMSGEGSYASEGWTRIFLWSTDYIYDPNSIYVPCFQNNLRHDGIVDLEPIIPELSATLTPHDPPIVIPFTGGSFDYTTEIENVGTFGATCDMWIEMDLPDSTTTDPIILQEGMFLAAGSIYERDFTQEIDSTASAGTYTHRMNVGVYPGTVYAYDEFQFTKEFPSGLIPEEEQPQSYVLMSIYPNPFNPVTTVSFNLSNAEYISLDVFDAQGRLVTSLVESWKGVGTHKVSFDATDLSGGIYFARMEAGNFTTTQKLVLLK